MQPSQKTKANKTIRVSYQWQAGEKKGKKSCHSSSATDLDDPKQLYDYVEVAMESASYDPGCR